MKKYTNILFLMLFTCLFVSWNTFQNNDYTFKRKNQKISLRIENGMNYLRWNEKTKLIVNTKKIDPKKLSLSAPGLRLIVGATDFDSESVWEITTGEKLTNTDTLTLFLSCRDLKDKFWSHQFKIPIKEY